MAEGSKALVKTASALTRFDPKARNKLVVRGLVALSEARDADFYFFKGEEHRIRDELEQALDNYQKALDIDPTHSDSLFFMGYCYLWIACYYGKVNDNPRRAIEALETLKKVRKKAASRSFHDYQIHYNLGLAREVSGLYEEAIMSYEKAIELNPIHWSSYYGLGNAQSSLGLYEEAIESYGQATELNPQYCQSYYGLGLCQQHIGLNHQALENFEIYLSLNSDKSRDRVDYAKRMVELLKPKVGQGE
jgi:tetratricopeptide (TPR) repeat protein